MGPPMRTHDLHSSDAETTASALAAVREKWSGWTPKPLVRLTFKDIVISPDGAYCASGGVEGAIKIWEMETGRLVRLLGNGDSSWLDCVAYSPNGRLIAAA